MKVIGIFGSIGAGKDEVAKYLVNKYDYSNVSYGDIVRQTSKKMGFTKSRSNLQKTREICDEKYGKEYFPERVVETVVKNNLKKAIISGIRNPEDAIIPKKIFGKNMILVFIEADKEKRFRRLKKRASERDPKTKREFNLQEKRELEIFNFKERT